MKFSDLKVGTILKINNHNKTSCRYTQIIHIDTESIHELHEICGIVKHSLPINIFSSVELCPIDELEIAKKIINEKKVEVL